MTQSVLEQTRHQLAASIMEVDPKKFDTPAKRDAEVNRRVAVMTPDQRAGLTESINGVRQWVRDYEAEEQGQ